VLYHVITAFGIPGLLILRYALTAGIALLGVWCARRRGAQWPVIIALAPLAIILGHVGLMTIRAQMFTLVSMAALLLMLDVDRHGKRWWIVPWLLIYVLWLNLHAGFVVGLALCGAHWIEQVIRTRSRQWHLIFTGIAMAALTFVNPYGWHYVPFVWEAVTMDRPLVPEWWPLWRASGLEALPFFVFLFAMLMLVYVMARSGVRSMPGILIVLLCSYAAVRHQRHASLCAVALLCYVPGYIQFTPLGRILDELWQRRSRVIAAAFAVMGLGLLLWMPNRPWALQVPTTGDDAQTYTFAYPIGAVDYLHDNNFQGNVMTPYVMGAYVTWKLHPKVKVSMDGRYEVAYQPGVVEEVWRLYNGEGGWEEVLTHYPTDVILVPRDLKLATLMPQQPQWRMVYRDDAMELYERPGLELPVVDRTGQKLEMRLP
jgi:hypothetical protein